MKNSHRRLWFLLSVIILAAAVQTLFFGKPLRPGGKLQAPLFTAEFGTQIFDLKAVIGQKVVLINFWATWCPPCRDEVPLLNELVKNVGSDKFVVVALMEDNKPTTPARREQELADFTQKIPISYPIFADPEGHIADAYGTYKLPESYLIDAHGMIIDKQVGAYAPQQMRKLLQRIRSEIDKL